MTITTFASVALLVLAAAVKIGAFSRIGPIETQKGMTRLAIGIAALGIAVGLTQSGPAKGPGQTIQD